MKEHSEQHLDKLAKKVMESSSLDMPSSDFTANIMAKIEAPGLSSITTYKPLISKKAWFIILALIIGTIYYLSTIDSSQSTGLLDKVDLSIVTDNKFIDAVSSIAISKVLIYAITFFGAAWFIQISLLKYQFNKRLNY